MRQRRWILPLLAVLGLAGAAAPGRAAGPLAACGGLASATSMTFEDSDECSDFFILDRETEVTVHLEAGAFAGTLGAVLSRFPESNGPWLKRVFIGDRSLDGPADMTVRLEPGEWRLRGIVGRTPPQPCAPATPVGTRLISPCNIAPGAAIGIYRVSASG
jgi:hypothetical protein